MSIADFLYELEETGGLTPEEIAAGGVAVDAQRALLGTDPSDLSALEATLADEEAALAEAQAALADDEFWAAAFTAARDERVARLADLNAQIDAVPPPEDVQGQIDTMRSELVAAGVHVVPWSIDRTGATNVLAALTAWADTVPDGDLVTPSRIHLAGGTYRLDGTWQHTNLTSVVLDGGGGTLDFSAVTNIPYVRFSAAEGSGGPGVGGTLIAVDNLTIKGSNTTGASGVNVSRQTEHALAFHGCAFVDIGANVTLQDCWGDGIYLRTLQTGPGAYRSCSDVHIGACTITRAGRQGIGIAGAIRVEIDGADIWAHRSGIDLEPLSELHAVTDIDIRNVTFRSNGLGHIAAAGEPVHRVTVDGCTFLNRRPQIQFGDQANADERCTDIALGALSWSTTNTSGGVKLFHVDGVRMSGWTGNLRTTDYGITATDCTGLTITGGRGLIGTCAADVLWNGLATNGPFPPASTNTPSFVAAATNSGNTTSATVTIPPTARAGLFALLVVHVHSNTAAPPAGWSWRTGDPVVDGTLRSYAAWKLLDASDITAGVLTAQLSPAGTATRWAAALVLYDEVSALHGASASADAGTDAVHETPTLAVTAETLILRVVGDRSSSGFVPTSVTLPAGHTSRAQVWWAGGTLSAPSLVVAEQDTLAAADTTAAAASFTFDQPNQLAVGRTFALTPGPAAPPDTNAKTTFRAGLYAGPRGVTPSQPGFTNSALINELQSIEVALENTVEANRVFHSFLSTNPWGHAVLANDKLRGRHSYYSNRGKTSGASNAAWRTYMQEIPTGVHNATIDAFAQALYDGATSGPVTYIFEPEPDIGGWPTPNARIPYSAAEFVAAFDHVTSRVRLVDPSGTRIRIGWCLSGFDFNARYPSLTPTWSRVDVICSDPYVFRTSSITGGANAFSGLEAVTGPLALGASLGKPVAFTEVGVDWRNSSLAPRYADAAAWYAAALQFATDHQNVEAIIGWAYETYTGTTPDTVEHSFWIDADRTTYGTGTMWATFKNAMNAAIAAYS